MNYTHEELHALLEELHDRFNCVDFIEPDPISIPHSFSDPLDREIAGFLAATIAWGNRKAIVKSANRMMDYLDGRPYDFVMGASEWELKGLATYVHRTFNGMDLECFVRALRRVCRQSGSLGEWFQGEWENTGDMREVLAHFRHFFFDFDHPARSEKHLSSIAKGAACKRLNMYLRWMVRRDERGVDFGLWQRIPMSALYLPLDVHSGNVARALGLLERKQSDWRAVEQVTERLREFCPDDPVKYDYALFGAGINKV
ncbi:MAG: TIGR02757 family protein [Tidjanibacter sp.]|nr:TIGR02757 family protein [Tidjanibacter sp.]